MKNGKDEPLEDTVGSTRQASESAVDSGSFRVRAEASGVKMYSDRFAEAVRRLTIDRSFVGKRSLHLTTWQRKVAEHQRVLQALVEQYSKRPAPGPPPGKESLAGLSAATAPRPERLNPDRMVDCLWWWVPRKHREEAFRDIKEDIRDMRAAGLSEGQIRRRVLWELCWLLLSRAKVWKRAFWLWLAAQAREMLHWS